MRIWLVSLVLVAACGSSSDGTGPDGGNHAPKTGLYAYRMSFCDPYSGGCLPLTYDGQMTITFATEDSIAGSFNVPAMGPALDLGFWNVDAYVVYSRINSGSRIGTHRLTKSSAGLNCDGHVLDPSDFSTIPFTECTITYTGPLSTAPPVGLPGTAAVR